jgi:hypothetical protein
MFEGKPQGILKTQEVERRGTTPKRSRSSLCKPLGPHVIIEPPKAIIKHHPEAMRRHPDLDPHWERGVYLEFTWVDRRGIEREQSRNDYITQASKDAFVMMTGWMPECTRQGVTLSGLRVT